MKMNLLRSKKYWLLLFIISMSGLLFWLFTPEALPVETAQVSRGNYLQTINEEGKTRAKDIYTLSAPVDGKLLRINFKEGDKVNENAIVAVIQPSPSTLFSSRTEKELQEQLASSQAAYRQAEALADTAKVQLKIAQSDFNRLQPLVSKGFVTQSEFEHANLERQRRQKEYDAALHNLNGAEHSVAKAQASLLQTKDETNSTSNKIEIRSPINGSILRVNQKSEAVVSSGMSILEIADTTHLEVVTDVLSTDAPKIPPGAKVFITNWGGTDQLLGQVKTVEPSAFTKVSALGIEEQRVNVISDITSSPDQWKNLGDGYQVDTNIVVFEADNVLRVPMSAVFRDGNQWAVYTIKNGRATKQDVQISWHNPEMAVVANGLSENDIVILYPSEKLQDGMRVVSKH